MPHFLWNHQHVQQARSSSSNRDDKKKLTYCSMMILVDWCCVKVMFMTMSAKLSHSIIITIFQNMFFFLLSGVFCQHRCILIDTKWNGLTFLYQSVARYVMLCYVYFHIKINGIIHYKTFFQSCQSTNMLSLLIVNQLKCH